ncbi:hypothetical protein CAPTEDRAFT_213467 [Capitella teleta]|uniref:Uncharacterized protein n=1 Tax=Capitella teleta TaxID=283909 RepID=R7TPV5_CAPTE|nr:hypothetical protein CAPTEDRAFT_213467 [Capitella teleta]|eukprot:ELT93075.1 hypothetical protein CAPTEDRAFT_213467 [Capitella teleta]
MQWRMLNFIGTPVSMAGDLDKSCKRILGLGGGIAADERARLPLGSLNNTSSFLQFLNLDREVINLGYILMSEATDSSLVTIQRPSTSTITPSTPFALAYASDSSAGDYEKLGWS